MQEDRRLAVLRAIVEDYVATEEPVGSKALVERHRLGVSPATVRNDMAALEEEGFITQPHTSAGRVPTDKGYRLFVDRLTTVKPMSAAEKRAIATFLDGAVDLDDVVQPLGAAALAADPPGRGRAVPHALPLHRPPRRAGRAGADPAAGRADPQHRPGRAARRRARRRARPTTTLADLRTRLNRGRRRRAPSPTRSTALRAARPEPVDAATPTAAVVARAGRGDVRPPLRRAGRGRRHRQPGPVRRQLRLRRPAAARGARGARRAAQAARRGARTGGAVTVRIGARGPLRGARRRPASSRPATAPATRRWRPLGIVGPTRMDYPGTMAAVRAVARYVSRILDEA